MDASLIVAIVGTTLSGVIGAAGLVIALLARRDTQQLRKAEAAKAGPNVAVHVLRCFHAFSDASNTTVKIVVAVENSSTLSDVLSNVRVTMRNTERSTIGESVRPRTYPMPLAIAESVRPRTYPMPLAIAASTTVEVEFEMDVGERLTDAPNIPATLRVDTKRGATAQNDFTVYQR